MISGKLNYIDAAPIIAMAVAFHEIESKGGRGMESVVPLEDMAKRYKQLKGDQLILNVSQSLKGPTGQEALKDALKNNPNQEQAFAGLVDSMYRKAVLSKQQRENEKKPQEEQKGNEEPKRNEEQKVNEEPKLMGNL